LFKRFKRRFHPKYLLACALLSNNAGQILDTCVRSFLKPPGSVPIRLAGPNDTGNLGEGTLLPAKFVEIALGGLATACKN